MTSASGVPKHTSSLSSSGASPLTSPLTSKAAKAFADPKVSDAQVPDTQVSDADAQVPDTQVFDAQVPDTQVFDAQVPDTQVNVREVFGVDDDMPCPAFSQARDHVPLADDNYCFDPDTTQAILAGFSHNRRVLVQGRHGSGKSTHIEQVAARLRWPCIRVNLDSHVSRVDLVGKDAIVLRQGKQITQFRPGIIPWCLSRPMALVFDEYDAGRSDVMFVIQRLLEEEGKFTLLDRNEVITPHPAFRLFATANTLGIGDESGMYHGTQPINQGQMDRWNIIAGLDYLSPPREYAMLAAKSPEYDSAKGRKTLRAMVALANLTREGFRQGDLSTLMSPRTLISWMQNRPIFSGDLARSFIMTFLNRCEESERPLIAEYYQRCFNAELRCSVAPDLTKELTPDLTKESAPERTKERTKELPDHGADEAISPSPLLSKPSDPSDPSPPSDVLPPPSPSRRRARS